MTNCLYSVLRCGICLIGEHEELHGQWPLCYRNAFADLISMHCCLMRRPALAAVCDVTCSMQFVAVRQNSCRNVYIPCTYLQLMYVTLPTLQPFVPRSLDVAMHYEIICHCGEHFEYQMDFKLKTIRNCTKPAGWPHPLSTLLALELTFSTHILLCQISA